MEVFDKAEIGIIGGTGVYGIDGLEAKEELVVPTPYGLPSSKIIVGTLDGVKVAFLARHDTNHRLTPSEIPFRANIYALKLLGVKYILSFGAVGSLREELKPLDVVLVDQYIDKTKLRCETFFGEGIIAHVSLAEPVCHKFKSLVKEAAESIKLPGVIIHEKGTYICIEGPGFSSKSESHYYRTIGGSVIGMTACPEIKLAREAEIAYALVALVTDYDCWHPDHGNVTVEMVVKTLHANGNNAKLIVKQVVNKLKDNKFASDAHNSLRDAILTHQHNIPPTTYEKLKPIISKYR